MSTVLRTRKSKSANSHCSDDAPPVASQKVNKKRKRECLCERNIRLALLSSDSVRPAVIAKGDGVELVDVETLSQTSEFEPDLYFAAKKRQLVHQAFWSQQEQGHQAIKEKSWYQAPCIFATKEVPLEWNQGWVIEMAFKNGISNLSCQERSLGFSLSFTSSRFSWLETAPLF